MPTITCTAKRLIPATIVVILLVTIGQAVAEAEASLNTINFVGWVSVAITLVAIGMGGACAYGRLQGCQSENVRRIGENEHAIKSLHQEINKLEVGQAKIATALNGLTDELKSRPR